MKRRTFLMGIAGILTSGMAPAVVGSGILMPVRTIWRPAYITTFEGGIDWDQCGIPEWAWRVGVLLVEARDKIIYDTLTARGYIRSIRRESS